MRRYGRFGCRNLRSVGGFPLPGGTAEEDVLFRSDLPVELTAADGDFLREKDIRTVIDLRDADEVRARPDALADCPLVCWHGIPLGGLIPTAEDAIPESYLAYARNGSAMIQILTLLCGEGACLLHCTAGKDRTGTVAALALWLAGAAPEDIAADYAVSHALLRPILRDLRAARPDLPAFAGQSRPEYLYRFLELLEGEFPTPAAYLADLGLPLELADRLGAKLRGEG